MADQNIQRILSGCINGPGPNGEIITSNDNTVKPLIFLGGTVLGFNASLGIGPTEESSLEVELINDCKAEDAEFLLSPQGDYFTGEIRIGSPVFFDTCEAMGIDLTKFKPINKAADATDPPCFKFGGLLQSYTAKQGSSGLTFSARVVDPRSLLSNVIIVVSNTLVGPIKHRNYYNVFAYYESAILPPDKRHVQPQNGYVVPGGNRNAIDGPVTVGGEEKFADCSVFGRSNSDSRGMTYASIIHAINNMNPLVYSPNYGELFNPPADGRDGQIAVAENILRHQNNVFRLDLSGLPDPPTYLRAPGPSLTLLDLINTICESTGHEFIVTLEENDGQNPNDLLHKITIKTKEVAKNLNSFRSTILSYNGRSIDLSYGKELKTDAKTRTMMLGEQRHEMVESSQIEMYFGIDKNGDPIVAKREEEDKESRCGFYIEIYMDDLNQQLDCPLYDYKDDPTVGQVKDELVIRKVQVDEFIIRAALSSYELWSKYVFNPIIDNDFVRLIQYNFPDEWTAASRALLLGALAAQARAGEAGNELPPDQRPVQEPDGAIRALGDAMNVPVAHMIGILEEKRKNNIKKVFDFIANIGRTYYAKKYLVTINKSICAISEGLQDINYLGTDNETVPVGNVTVYNDPCNKDNNVDVANKIFRPDVYSHIPTNDGAWIERCGSVLGLGVGLDENRNVVAKPEEQPYIDFFRTEDYRVGPVARIDSKTFVRLREEADKLIDEAKEVVNEEGVTITTPPSQLGLVEETVAQILNDGSINPDYEAALGRALEEQIEKKFYHGVCGELDFSKLNSDDYIVIREYGYCNSPPPVDPLDGEGNPDPMFQLLGALTKIDIPSRFYIKFSVDEKIFILPAATSGTPEESGCKTYFTKYTNRQLNADPCCGIYQNKNIYSPCYTNVDDETLALINDVNCIENIGTEVVEAKSCSVVKIPITFNNPLYSKPCDGLQQLDTVATAQALLLGAVSGVLADSGTKKDPKTQLELFAEIQKFKPSDIFCNNVKPQKINILTAAVDAPQANNEKIVPTAHIPDLVAIPLKSNIETYGPWYSTNFDTSSGGIELKHDPDFCPWFFGSVNAMNAFAKDIIAENQINLTEIETGNVNYPYWPEIPLGFLTNGPNLTRVNVSFGSNGVSTNYTFQSYTPQFAKAKTLEKEILKNSIKNRNRLEHLAREKERKLDTLKRKDVRNNPSLIGIPLPAPVTEQGTLQRVIVGEMYPFHLLSTPNYITIGSGEEAETAQSGFNVYGTGDRTVIGTDTLKKSIIELRYDYQKKAFMSWDGLLSPVSISGDGGFPMYAAYSIPSGGSGSAYSGIISCPNVPTAPIPPMQVSGKHINNISINQHYLNPLTNSFGENEYHHVGSGAGHVVDIVGKGTGVPDSGIIMNFYGQDSWEEKYADDYRFLGLKGPLVLHAWGYDTQGKPIPNRIDDLDLIKDSGIFRTSYTETSGALSGTEIGLQDYFLKDWLHKPSAWPVAPVDLRYDRQRGVWVSPPQHKIVVVETSGNINAYSTGVGYLINEKDGKKYGHEIYDSSGNLVSASGESNNTKIIIEDRIGIDTGAGTKSYAYFDAFSSTYLLMGGGGSTIKIGKFCNQWPSLSNVKDPANAVKKVALYQPASDCSAYGSGLTSCPWAFEPVTETISGVVVPVVVDVVNLFANVAAHEYQTKWCSIAQVGSNYILLAAEC